MKGTSQNYSIPPLYDNDSNELIYDDKIKANLLNKYFCSISIVDDTNHVPPDIPSRKISNHFFGVSLPIHLHLKGTVHGHA
jgi:hypothetical protein